MRPLNYTEDTIFVRTPNVTHPDDVVVSHGINGQQYNPDITLNKKDPENTFTYYGRPIITNYYPHKGPSVGGTIIKITGFGFTPFKDNDGKPAKRPVWIRLRKYNATNVVTKSKPADYVDNENIHWTAPPGEGETHHIMELSLNDEDFYPIIPINESYSYTYYSSPRVDNLYPTFGPLGHSSEIMLFIKGRNFNCYDDNCTHVSCRFSKGDEAIYVPAKRISPTEIHCQVPKYNRPDVVPVEISLDDEYYTSDNKEFGFYDPFVWNVKPKMVSRKGNTTIRIHGYGFVNTTGTSLKVRYGLANRRLLCRNGPCTVMGKYIDQNTIEAHTFPYNDVVYADTGLPLDRDEFAVEVSVYGDDYTNNNATIFYFLEPGL